MSTKKIERAYEADHGAIGLAADGKSLNGIDDPKNIPPRIAIVVRPDGSRYAVVLRAGTGRYADSTEGELRTIQQSLDREIAEHRLPSEADLMKGIEQLNETAPKNDR